jgi:REP element-mobilizing transposase RayT
LSGDLERAVQRAIAAKCHELSAEVVALGGTEDHVHLLTSLPATLAVAELVGKVKGTSSHLATHEVLRGGEFFTWQDAYGAVSVSPRHLPTVADYIARQREHHAAAP